MTRSTIARIASMAWLVAALMIILGADARAQRQGTISVSNNTACDVTVCGPKGNNCIVIPAGGHYIVQIPCATFQLNIQSCGALTPIALGQCLDNVNVGDCCADICFGTGIVSCTYFLTIDPAAGPCPCKQLE